MIEDATPHLYISALPFSMQDDQISMLPVMGMLLIPEKKRLGLLQEVKGVLYGHNGQVYSAAFSPDGSRIVSASADKTIRIWDAQTGTQIGQSLTGHADSV